MYNILQGNTLPFLGSYSPDPVKQGQVAGADVAAEDKRVVFDPRYFMVASNPIGGHQCED